MFRYLFILLLSFNFSFANENVVKTSELELFLFKVGFESLLKDVDITKDKSSLNEKEIKSLNEKIELIMSELYKDNRLLLNDTVEKDTPQNFDKEELESLKKEISLLKNEVLKLKENSKEITKINKEQNPEIKELKSKKINTIKKTENKVLRYITKVDGARLRIYPSIGAKILDTLPKNQTVYLDYCDRFGWCKIKGKREFIARQVLWAY